ncbi:MAG: elongation factor Ts [Candidatus Nealsonbacteria bacterium RIFOXYB1_FULL_40_15]|uniref:Elongation factor Ts n=2 Tax=Candidatus Nealsoniibacteriota TaxID=1817911 RepID=A0A1G2ER79_9BACT|nr:MAG: elongation factor Ts [Candidatus Nealsonbacteria bacterium RIFOXYB1_FULL_40_15]OGZ27850.1 MAG: elongation factor Ts [Candidatus Nealsonbacteria bacterium RIFOXYC1_FULL_40_7]OGZ28010.1 MAG: elongation factor Ts [Candidatus Nealsonbacteria bacterium RIFOXYD1_FULL_39_11]
MADLEQLKQLREETGVSVSECKKALEESAGNLEKAKEILRKWGKQLAGKKSERVAKAGIVESYIHAEGRVGVLLEIRSETDFVSKSEEFRSLAHEVCLHIAAAKPLFLSEETIPEDFLEREKKIYLEQLKGKPENLLNQIIEGKLKKFKEEVSLLSQPWIKDEEKTIRDLVNDYIAKLGENIIIKNFARFEI